jgi:diketogulonate reductase-like aldo/keto reductase
VNKSFEVYVGNALSETSIPREDLFVQSKFVAAPHHPPFNPPYPEYEGQNAEEACHLSFLRSLENLKTLYLDAFLINAPEITPDSMLPLLKLLMRLKDSKKTRYAGVCNIATVETLSQLHRAVPGAIQIVQNPLHSPWDPEYRIPRYCREHGIQYNTFNTLTGSDRIVKSPPLKSIAEENGTTPQVAFLQYCVQTGITPLVGARSQDNLRSSLLVANGEGKQLAKEQMHKISRLMAEQSIINRFRGTKLLERRNLEMKKEKGTQKMKSDQAKFLRDTYVQREEEQQQVVARAKARAEALAEKLRQKLQENPSHLPKHQPKDVP